MERKEHIREWFKQLKENVECTSCGFKHPAAMEFHHRDPKEKRFTISNMVHNGFEITQIQTELDKTIPLCKNCHAIYHWDECASKRSQYGTQMNLDL